MENENWLKFKLDHKGEGSSPPPLVDSIEGARTVNKGTWSFRNKRRLVPVATSWALELECGGCEIAWKFRDIEKWRRKVLSSTMRWRISRSLEHSLPTCRLQGARTACESPAILEIKGIWLHGHEELRFWSLGVVGIKLDEFNFFEKWKMNGALSSTTRWEGLLFLDVSLPTCQL